MLGVAFFAEEWYLEFALGCVLAGAVCRGGCESKMPKSPIVAPFDPGVAFGTAVAPRCLAEDDPLPNGLDAPQLEKSNAARSFSSRSLASLAC